MMLITELNTEPGRKRTLCGDLNECVRGKEEGREVTWEEGRMNEHVWFWLSNTPFMTRAMEFLGSWWSRTLVCAVAFVTSNWLGPALSAVAVSSQGPSFEGIWRALSPACSQGSSAFCFLICPLLDLSREINMQDPIVIICMHSSFLCVISEKNIYL